jgi:hypothetical protein
VKSLSLSKKEAIKSVVIAILAVSLVAAAIHYLVETPISTSSSSSMSFAGPITFRFLGNNSTEATVVAGSSVQGTIPVNITGASWLNFYVDDRGTLFNTTKPTLPAGISVSLNMYGNSYDAVSLTAAYANQSISAVPLVPTTQGETNFQYTVSAASSVPAGVYKVLIVFQSVTNDGELYGFEKGTLHYGYAAVYEVILHVQ